MRDSLFVGFGKEEYFPGKKENMNIILSAGIDNLDSKDQMHGYRPHPCATYSNAWGPYVKSVDYFWLQKFKRFILQFKS